MQRDSSAWGEFVAWASTPIDPVTVDDRYRLDEAKARDRLAAEDFVLEQPVEPELTSTDGVMKHPTEMPLILRGGKDGGTPITTDRFAWS